MKDITKTLPPLVGNDAGVVDDKSVGEGGLSGGVGGGRRAQQKSSPWPRATATSSRVYRNVTVVGLETTRCHVVALFEELLNNITTKLQRQCRKTI